MRKTRIISAVAAIALAAPIMCLPAQAKPRGGCNLTPLSYDETGVLPDSLYTLTGDAGDSPIITINDTITSTVTKSGDSFTVTPDAPLAYNKLYTFTLQKDEPVSWTFQTAEKFCVERTVPGTDGYNVPVNTGIEIVFSHSNFNIDTAAKNVTFSPKLSGKWEKHDKTAVFVPNKPLENDMTYTVTVASPMANNDGYTLDKDYTFEFTVESAEDTDYKRHFSFFSNTSYTEVPENIPASISYGIYSDDKRQVEINSTAYRVSPEDALKVLSGSRTMYELAENSGTGIFNQSETIQLNDVFYTDYTLKLWTLSRGFYLIKSTAQDKTAYTLVQATDTAAYIMRDKNGYLIRLNNFNTGEPVENAGVVTDSGCAGVSDEYGIANISVTADDKCSYIAVSDTASGKALGYYPIYDDETLNRNLYHTALDTDRSIYKTTDTVQFWGVAKNTADNSSLTNLTAELYGGYFYSDDTPIAAGKIEYSENAFTGALELSDIDEGYYTLYIKNGGEYITSTSVRVENFKKPAYKLTAEPDKKAIFYGDSIRYTVSTAFYEGTALPSLDVSCNHGGAQFINQHENSITDISGQTEITVTPTLSNPEYYGFNNYYRFSSYATFPETGDIYTYDAIRVFFSNIRITSGGSYEDGKSIVKLHSDTITLDRINDGTAKDSSDYIDKSDPKREINGTLYFNRYVKQENGTRYDYYQKKNVTSYYYTTEKEAVQTVKLSSDSDGNTQFEFKPEHTYKEGYYTFEYSSKDDEGRAYNGKCYVPSGEKSFYRNYYDDGYMADLDKESYSIGDEVTLTVTRGLEGVNEPILFIKVFDEIKDAQIVNDGIYKTTFNEIPGAYIYGIIFEPGIGYREIAREHPRFNSENNILDFEVSADKEEYLPGESCTLDISVKDSSQQGVKADINISVVDEAVFALADHASDIASQLFDSYIAPLAHTAYSSHAGNTVSNRYSGSSGGGVMLASATADKAAAESAADEGGVSSIGTRSDFKDTALYTTAETDENGIAHVTFNLPDNITSWHAVLGAVTADLQAGNYVVPIKVTMPSFISFNMADTYLIGDSPSVGVTVYGGSLTGEENITILLQGKEWETEKTGSPFERINVPMPQLTDEGEKSVTITAYADGEPVDAVEAKFNVTDTYNRTDTAELYSSPFDTIRSGDSGSVSIIFTDKTKASMAQDLMYLRRSGSDRLDAVTASYTAALIAKDIYGLEYDITKPDFKAYQSYDGGMKLFTYSDSELDITAQLTPYIKDYVNTEMLIDYLRSFEDEPKALYALAALREPVMNKLSQAAAAENLSASDYLYIILAYCELGETDTAAEIFSSRIEPLTENLEPLKRVHAGEDTDSINEATALAALAARYMERDDWEALYQYSLSSADKDVSTDILKLGCITASLKTLPKEAGNLTYSIYGKEYTADFDNNRSHTVTIPAQKITEFKVIAASESVSMLSVSKEKIYTDETDNPAIEITRRYYNNSTNEEATVFNEMDIIRVEIDVNFKNTAAGGGYILNDYLPSGLAAIENNSRGTDAVYSSGQRVTQYIWHGGSEEYAHKHITYYARVTNPGSYTADNGTIQYMSSNNILAATERTDITIE